MDAEYKRLEAEGREVEHQIQELIKSPVTRTPEHLRAEQQLAELHTKLGSLRQGMMLIWSVNSTAMQKHIRWFVEALSHRFYSLYPALVLLGISRRFTLKVRTRMAQTAVLPGAFAESRGNAGRTGLYCFGEPAAKRHCRSGRDAGEANGRRSVETLRRCARTADRGDHRRWSCAAA